MLSLLEIRTSFFFSQSIIPTQQQLQEIYEENLRQREISKLSSDSAARAQFLEDERVALMLQNEEFMSELRRDQVIVFFFLIGYLRLYSSEEKKVCSKNGSNRC